MTTESSTIMQPIAVVSVDIETTGPVPGLTSMISLAAVLLDIAGNPLGPEFNMNLEELDLADRSPSTMAWWATQPDSAWEAATRGAQDPMVVMRLFASWLEHVRTAPNHPGGDVQLIFAGWPVGFDWAFVNYYLRRFVDIDAAPLGYSPVCLKSFAAGLLRNPAAMLTTKEEGAWPAAWDVENPHPHEAIWDARSQGELYRRMVAWACDRGLA